MKAAVDSQQRAKLRQRWETVAATMPDFSPAYSTGYYRRREIALLQRCVGPLQGKRVLKLDLWNEAINTRILQWIESQGARAFGIDISLITSRKALGNCRAAGHQVHLSQADICNIPFVRESFDLVYTMGTIEHVPDYPAAIDEIYRVLKPGGLAIVGVPHKWDPFLRPALVALLECFGKYPYSPEKSFGSRELRGLLESAHLKVRERTGLLAFPAIIRMAELFLLKRRIALHRLSALLAGPFEFAESRWKWPARFGYLIAMVAVKPPRPQAAPHPV